VCGFLKGVRALSLSPSCALFLSPSLFLLPSKGTLLSLRHLSFSLLLVGLQVCGQMGWAGGQTGGREGCLSVRPFVRLCMRISTYVCA
jgi:hypothetical protein